MDERFYQTLERLLLSEVSYFFDDETEHLKDVIFCFDTHGAFLDAIPIDEREPIVRKIFHWIDRLWLNNYRRVQKEIQNPSKPIEKIRKYQTVIKHMIELCESEHIGQTTIEIKSISSLTRKKPSKEEQFYRFLLEMKQDLEEKKFKIFDKTSFYMEDITKKEELVAYLSYIIEKYNIPKAKRKIKELIDCIPNPTF